MNYLNELVAREICQVLEEFMYKLDSFRYEKIKEQKEIQM